MIRSGVRPEERMFTTYGYPMAFREYAAYQSNQPPNERASATPGGFEPTLRVHEQLCQSYRAIDDFRTKLQGFLPVAIGMGIFLLADNLKVSKDLPVETKGLMIFIGFFGLLVTLALFAFEIYGIRKCGALIRAGQRMEASRQVWDRQFLSRPQNIAGLLNEPFAAGLIYSAVQPRGTFFVMTFAWPGATPFIPLIVLVTGFAGTLGYDHWLRDDGKQSDMNDQPQPTQAEMG